MKRQERFSALSKSQERVSWEAKNERSAHLQVLCASFILHLHRNDSRAYELLLRLASGALVSEVILDCQTPAGSAQLESLVLALDAPFLMSLLDLASEESFAFAKAVCAQLEEHNAKKIATFRHCVMELQDNLNAVISRVRDRRGFGATARRLSGSPIRGICKFNCAGSGQSTCRRGY